MVFAQCGKTPEFDQSVEHENAARLYKVSRRKVTVIEAGVELEPLAGLAVGGAILFDHSISPYDQPRCLIGCTPATTADDCEVLSAFPLSNGRSQVTSYC